MAKEVLMAGFVVYFRLNLPLPLHNTGAYPATHGIYYNSPLNQMVKQDVGIGKVIKTETLWDAVRKSGKQVQVLFGLFPWCIIDYNIPEVGL
jgi:hypothetical protein